MKVQEVILKAMSGEINWIQAARILGMTDRNMRRLRWKFENQGYGGLVDRRTGRPSPKRAPLKDVEKILRLYRKKYFGFNVRHYHQKLTREHKVKYSYTFVKKALQDAGLIKKRRKRGKHRLRREPKPCFGQMLHIDGSKHQWLALKPELWLMMILILDDATSRLLYAQLWPGETAEAIMTALWYVVDKYGIPMSLYSDRAGWAFSTPKAGGRVSKEQLTHVGKALSVLGVEHIPSYSPQARGRSERSNRTHQDRLVNELRAEGICEMEAANRYISQKYLPEHNELYARSPKDPANVFVSARRTDLDQVFCFEETRTVGRDNTVVRNKVVMQIEKQKGVVSCEGWKVLVRRHLDGRQTIWRGVKLLGAYDSEGIPIPRQTKRRRQETPLRATPSAESQEMWLQ
jgi:transposase